MPANLYLGLISGTSADGIDAALVEFDDANDARSTARLVFGRTYPWQSELRAQLVELGQHAARVSLDTNAELAVRLGRASPDAPPGALANRGTTAPDRAAHRSPHIRRPEVREIGCKSVLDI